MKQSPTQDPEHTKASKKSRPREKCEQKRNLGGGFLFFIAMTEEGKKGIKAPTFSLDKER